MPTRWRRTVSRRATGALDIWVRPTPENAERVWGALADFGAPLDSLAVAELAEEDLVFQVGVPPLRIDILTSVSGVQFEDAFRAHITVDLEGLKVPVLGRDHLIMNKRAAGRPRDLADVAMLEDEATRR